MGATPKSEAGNGGGSRDCTIVRGGEGKSLAAYLSEGMQLCMWTATDFREKGNPVGHLLAVIGSEIWTARVNSSRLLHGWKVGFSTAEETQEVLKSFVELHHVLDRAQAVTGCGLPVDQLAAAIQVWLDLGEKKPLPEAA